MSPRKPVSLSFAPGRPRANGPCESASGVRLFRYGFQSVAEIVFHSASQQSSFKSAKAVVKQDSIDEQ